MLLEGLLRYWPFANGAKEIIFLTELQEVLEFCEIDIISGQIEKLFKRIVKCVGGTHMQVADRALGFFEDEDFLEILTTYKDRIFPLLVPKIVDLAENHWHEIFKRSMNTLKTIILEVDEVAFEKALKMKPKDFKSKR
jgi:serine/threonine-protein phosphatase 2A regulatory subunit B'